MEKFGCPILLDNLLKLCTGQRGPIICYQGVRQVANEDCIFSMVMDDVVALTICTFSHL